MRHTRIRGLVFWLSACLCSPLIASCGGDASDPLGALSSGTETGNPPSVQVQKLSLFQRARGVAVVGEPGAIAPANSSVQVTNLRTGESARGVAADDGSLNLELPGSLEDGYELTVSNGARQTTVQLGTDASNPVGQLDSVSCESLETELVARIADSYSTASAACSSDLDCGVIHWGINCSSQCGQSYVADAAGAEARAVQDTQPICSELGERCPRPGAMVGQCAPGYSLPAACIDGACTAFDTEERSCDEVQSRAGARRNESVTRAGSECELDADCTIIEASISCVADCGAEAAILASKEATLRQEVGDIDLQFCGPFSVRSCPGPFPFPCPPTRRGPRSAVCRNNQCEIEYVE